MVITWGSSTHCNAIKKNTHHTGADPVLATNIFDMSNEKEKEKENGQSMNQKIMERLVKYNKEKENGRGTEKSKRESK